MTVRRTSRTRVPAQHASMTQMPIVPVEASSMQEAEDRALAQQFAGGTEFAEAYLYAYKDPKIGKHIIGPNVDFVRQIVAHVVNRSGKADLDISEHPPVIEDIVIDGKPGIRVITCAIDRKTGKRKWGVVEELRTNRHAAYIALQKAERRALEGHPAYDRRKVAAEIRKMLLAQGLNPDNFVIAGGARGSEWARLFGQARQNGIPPETLREHVRSETGKGLSEVATPTEAAEAIHAAEDAIEQGDRTDRAVAEEISSHLHVSAQTLVTIWGKLGVSSGGLGASAEDWRRMRIVMELISTGTGLGAAIAKAFEKHPTHPTQVKR